MVAWYWVLISVVVSNFLTVLLSYKINFEDFWEDSLFALFYPFVWVGIFPYVFFRNFFISVTRQQFEEVATGADKKTIYKLSKNVYLWHDKKAKKIHNRWFLVRIK
nr:MAG TPA: hypothetical protein [Caudoviricetes sp.]